MSRLYGVYEVRGQLLELVPPTTYTLGIELGCQALPMSHLAGPS